MKILFIGDYQKIHSILARALRARGHQADVVSGPDGNGSIRLNPPSGLLGGMTYLYRLMQMLPRLSGYDVVQVDHPEYFSLRPGRLAYITRRLEESNGKLFLTAMKPDYFYVDACRKGEMFRFSPFRTGKDKTPLADCTPEAEYSQLGGDRRDYVRWFHTRIAGVAAASPETQAIFEAVRGREIPALPAPRPVAAAPERRRSGKVQLVVPGSWNDDLLYGRDLLRHLAERLAAEMPDDCALVKGSLAAADPERPVIMFDNCNSYAPGPHALDAMAAGCVAVGGAQPEYAAFLGADPAEVPTVCAAPDNEEALEEELRRLIASPQLLEERGEAGREFMRRYHEADAVAARLEKILAG